MHFLRTRTHIVWLGILLVLMPLMAPAISHAVVRAQGGDAAVAAWIVGLDDRGWCSPQGSAQVSGDDAGVEAADEAPAAHRAAACDYCSWPAGLSAVPMLPAGLLDPALLPDAAPRHTGRATQAHPWPSAHGARAPPAVTARQA
ncbi:DUF2946 family protein [Sphaerotilus mobilis]|uniref:DUF2946 family protein n=1 Tax=Sphaerotilus mobilis TaxID=47994 RepID=A0A4Q7LSJ9_9BURK|nr:DUF2946 family protein [Sphaerotilus mobilis]RZS56619.1 DUF2946 family protein [Sphaerotilus mobilis]